MRNVWIFIIAALLSFAIGGMPRAEGQKGFGVSYQIVYKFTCPDEYVTPEHECSRMPEPEDLRVDGAVVNIVACSGSAHRAGLLVGDHILRVNAIDITSMNALEFEGFMNAESQKTTSVWVVKRPMGASSFEERTISITTGSFGDDFSCGKNENI